MIFAPVIFGLHVRLLNGQELILYVLQTTRIREVRETTRMRLGLEEQEARTLRFFHMECSYVDDGLAYRDIPVVVPGISKTLYLDVFLPLFSGFPELLQNTVLKQRLGV